jgi:adenine-specific DNA-methyltransferase
MSEEAFVTQTMLTCLGNKRKLVKGIDEIVREIVASLGKKTITIVDGFAGSTVVSRQLAYSADILYANDLERYSYLMCQCYLQTPSKENQDSIGTHIERMNLLAAEGPYVPGIICELYAPLDTNHIQDGERCFYTRENALIIDTLRKYIEEEVAIDLQTYCLVPLLTRASIHTNTAGVFKGFYKHDGIGKFGGKGEFALTRIMKPIRVDKPIWSSREILVHCSQRDINQFIEELPSSCDVIYLDPPYNQHPYGSNYFMLNVIASNERPENISKVSGIPLEWNKSRYNKAREAYDAMAHLIATGLTKSKYLLLSYNNEGIIPLSQWDILLEPYQVKKYEIPYDTYKGSRNLGNRSNKVVEIMYLLSMP